MRKIIIVLSAFFLYACGGKSTPTPDISFNTLQDFTYPCISVVFPDFIELKEMKEFITDGEKQLWYHVSMPSRPQYDITVLKRSAADMGNITWRLVPISDQYGDSTKVYEIRPFDVFTDRSAAVVLAEQDGNLYLRAVIGEFSGPNHVYMVTVDRMVQKGDFVRLFNFETWQNSVVGKKFIEDMKVQADWFYHNINLVNCNMNPRVDR